MIKDKILNIRGTQVILDRDLAELYRVEVKYLKRQVKRNIERFPKKFMFELNDEEFKDWRRQFVTSKSDRMGLRYHPFAFTEHGVSMLSSILRSKKAIEISIKIIESFIAMRKFLSKNASFFQKFQQIDQKFLEHDGNFDKIFRAMEDNTIPKQGIFYEGQIFDAHIFVSELINSAKKEIILIDNYIDESVLILFSESNANTTIITKEISNQLKLSLKKYNTQYKPIKIETSNRFHDRFLIIDNKAYHFGASIKDLGKKIFAFSKIKKDMLNIF
jgi:hypothetical protein